MQRTIRSVLGLLRGPAVVAALLAVLFAIRGTHLDRQDGYLDEGYHIHHALSAWSFDHNPAYFSDGKLLIYYWLGLWVRSEQGPAMLVVARSAMASFAVITGLTIYLIGRRQAGHLTGVIALALYAVLPLPFFYERMAMADPLAAGLGAITALAALVFVDRPTRGRAAVLGLLTGLAMMAKLTAAGLVFLPGLLAASSRRWSRGRFPTQAAAFCRRFALPLVLVAGAAASVWLPVLIPASTAPPGDEPLRLIHPTTVNLQPDDATRPSPARVVEYLAGLLPLLADFVGWGFLVALALTLVAGAVPGFLVDTERHFFVFLLQWLLLLGLPVWSLATLITARYAVVLAAPVCLLMALVLVTLWRRTPAVLVRGAVVGAVSVWLATQVAPFAFTALTAPQELRFSGANRVEHIDGFLISDGAVRSAAAQLNRIGPDDTAATWKTFYLIFYHLDSEPVLLRRNHPAGDLRRAVAALPEGRWLHLAMSDYPPFYEDWDDTEFEVLGIWDRPRIRRPVRVVRLRRRAEGADS